MTFSIKEILAAIGGVLVVVLQILTLVQENDIKKTSAAQVKFTAQEVSIASKDREQIRASLNALLKAELKREQSGTEPASK
jgi:hypothetical protein